MPKTDPFLFLNALYYEPQFRKNPVYVKSWSTMLQIFISKVQSCSLSCFFCQQISEIYECMFCLQIMQSESNAANTSCKPEDAEQANSCRAEHVFSTDD